MEDQATSNVIANIEAEAALLGALLQENRLIDGSADLLDPADFYEPLHGRIFEVVVREHSLGRRISPVGIKDFFSDGSLEPLGGQAYLARLTSEMTGLIMGVDLARQLADLSHRRKMHAGLTAAALACADMEAQIGEIIGHADAALSTSGKEQIHQPSGGECLDELITGLDDKDDGVRCNAIADLDRVLGPLKPKQLVICAGRPGMGKTATALSYAIGAARGGHGVLFISLEMSSRELAARIAADLCFDTECQVPFAAIQGGRLQPAERQKIEGARDFMHTLPFRVVDVGGLTVGRLNMLVRRHARRMAANGQKLELVVVDYLQLLSPDQRPRSNYEAVSEVSRALKAIAKDHGVAVMALAQLSREVEKRDDKRPQLADLRDSGQIEQDADAVLFLLRQEYYLRKAEPDEDSPKFPQWRAALDAAQGEIEFIVAKRRNGVEGRAVGRFYGSFQAVRGR